MRRAQVQHIMIFVIGLVVISLILLFGYTTLENLNEDRCEVQRIQFASNLQQAIDRNKAWGVSQRVDLKAPCDTAKVCFVDRDAIDNPPSGDYLHGDLTPNQRAAINDSVQTNKDVSEGVGDQTNVFTINTEGNVEPVERYSTASAALHIKDNLDPSSVCVPVEAEILKIRMEGTGKAVKIVGSGS